MTFIETVYGKDGVHRTPYLTRIKLTPKTHWGQLMLHIFHRGDADDHPHDHPWEFWTFPLTSYVEEAWEQVRDDNNFGIFPVYKMKLNHVDAFKWHHRPAEYMHRVLHSKYLKTSRYFGSVLGEANWLHEQEQLKEQCKELTTRIWTLVWTKPKRRSWFFLVDGVLVPWRTYVYGGEDANNNKT
ncbi:MAG: hypothetical protein KAJ19_02910 [Gammaproteobacteria bacterium]|nr:hypothetical protein [Gammaproteobacteria bacterium]